MSRTWSASFARSRPKTARQVEAPYRTLVLRGAVAYLGRGVPGMTRVRHSQSNKPVNRRFIVIEGLYQNHGDIAPLREIVRSHPATALERAPRPPLPFMLFCARAGHAAWVG